MTLFVGDAGALLISRQILLAVRDKGIVGGAIGSTVEGLIPRGSLNLFELLTAVLLALTIFGTYGPGDKRRDVRALLIAAAAGLMLECWGWLWSAFSWQHVAGCTLMLIGVAGMLVAERLCIEGFVQRVRRVRKIALRSIVIGAPDGARALLRDPALNDTATFNLVGYVNTTPLPERDALGGISELVEIIDRYDIDTLVLTGDCDADTCRAIMDIGDAAACHVLAASCWGQITDITPQLIWKRGVPLIGLTRPGLRGQQLTVKRIFDVLVASISLIALAPILLLIAIAIRLSSPGPILFSQIRVGRGGRHFRIYKFRSMIHGAEARRAELAERSIYGDARLFKIRDDPRITPLGRFLRRTSLDELPQLWNVLRGEMSLVGPRPPLPVEVSLYNDHHYSRFNMKPGITGPWQVAGRNKITDFEEVVRLEKSYMRQWTFGKDLLILLRTIFVVLRMEGAH